MSKILSYESYCREYFAGVSRIGRGARKLIRGIDDMLDEGPSEEGFIPSLKPKNPRFRLNRQGGGINKGHQNINSSGDIDIIVRETERHKFSPVSRSMSVEGTSDSKPFMVYGSPNEVKQKLTDILTSSKDMIVTQSIM